MPTTPIYALPYPASSDPADVPADTKKLADQVALVLGGALSATPPATPIEGQLWATSPVAGTVWVFRYNAGSASAFKWELAGGSPLASMADANLATSSTTYVDLAGGPTVTLPRAGEYLATFGALLWPSGVVGAEANMAVKLGAAAAADSERVLAATPAAGNMLTSVSRTMLRTAAAADVWKCQYRASTGSANFFNRFLTVIPVRVS